jgi:hypothetical protein
VAAGAAGAAFFEVARFLGLLVAFFAAGAAFLVAAFFFGDFLAGAFLAAAFFFVDFLAAFLGAAFLAAFFLVAIALWAPSVIAPWFEIWPSLWAHSKKGRPLKLEKQDLELKQSCSLAILCVN